MARTVTGKLKRDIRINHEGKADGGGRLYLRGEFVTVDTELRDAVDTKAKRPPRNKQATPDTSKRIGTLVAQVRQLEKTNAALEAQLTAAQKASG